MGKNSRHESVRKIIEDEKETLITMLPTHLQEKFRDQSFAGGGAIYSLYNGDEPKDYDFFLDNEGLANDLREYFTDYLVSKNNKLKDKVVKIGKYRDLKLIVTVNGISLGKYQIVTRWSGDVESVVNEFDFKHNMYYVYKGEIGTCVEWEYLDDNVLRFNCERARDLVGCIIRTRKFVERGFKLTNKEMSKMLLKLHEVGFNDRELEILNSSNRSFES